MRSFASSNSLINFSLALVVLTAGVTNVYFANGRILISMIPLGVGLLFYGIFRLKQLRYLISLRPQDYVLIVFFALAVLSALINPNGKSQTYLFAYGFTFVGLGLIMRNLFRVAGNWRWLNLANVLALIMTSAFCTIEFLYELNSNAPGVYLNDLQNFVPRASEWYGQGYCGTLPRAFGLSNEPTYLGWYFNTLGVLAVVFLWRELGWNVWLKSIFTTLIVLGYLSTFSSSTWAILLLGFVFAGVLKISSVRNAIRIIDLLPKLSISRRELAAIIFGSALVLGIFIGIAYTGERNLVAEIQSCLGDLEAKATLSKIDEVAEDKTTQIEEAYGKNVALPSKNNGLEPELQPRVPTGEATGRRIPAPDGGKITPYSLSLDDHRNTTQSQPMTDKSFDARPNARTPDSPQLPRLRELERVNFTRSRIWRDDFFGMMNKPIFGHGIGYLSSYGRSSSLSLPIFVGYEMGIPALLVLLAYFALLLRDVIWLTPKSYWWVFVPSISAGVLHLLTMTQHYYFNLWVLVGFLHLANRLKSGIKHV